MLISMILSSPDSLSEVSMSVVKRLADVTLEKVRPCPMTTWPPLVTAFLQAAESMDMFLQEKRQIAIT